MTHINSHATLAVLLAILDPFNGEKAETTYLCGMRDGRIARLAK